MKFCGNLIVLSLTEDFLEQRVAYVRELARSVRHGGHVIVAAFGSEGPKRCSGLDMVRYDAESLHDEFGTRFRLVESLKEPRQTRSEPHSIFYCYCRIE